MKTIIILGGGAAGIFSAISAKTAHPKASVLLIEKSAALLAKVRVSGGGRCNVTHACFDPRILTSFYPRGQKELLGPFHRFGPRSTIAWFEQRGVALKIENDGRVFPQSDSSETIIKCLITEAKTLGVELLTRQTLEHVEKEANGFKLQFKENRALFCHKLILATGSSTQGHTIAQALGHTIQSPVPSLFTLNIPTSPLQELSGVCVESVRLTLSGTSVSQQGPLLITHFGFSGPAALKLSSWGARHLYDCGYRATVLVNWLGDLSQNEAFKMLMDLKSTHPQNLLSTQNPFPLPKSLFKTFAPQKRLADCSIKELRAFAAKLVADPYLVEGKTTHKEEFVTCGGVLLSEVEFKSMQSKVCPNLFFAGEILNIDAVTGGFNFQNAWTTGFLAGSHSGL
jgi:predicted Rossmann fold flavoprotein